MSQREGSSGECSSVDFMQYGEGQLSSVLFNLYSSIQFPSVHAISAVSAVQFMEFRGSFSKQSNSGRSGRSQFEPVGLERRFEPKQLN